MKIDYRGWILIGVIIYHIYWFIKYDTYLTNKYPHHKRKRVRGSWRLTYTFLFVEIFRIPYPEDKKLRFYARNLQVSSVLLLGTLIIMGLFYN